MADLYIPPKPAIIRATELPRSPAEARGIALHNAFGPAPVFMAAGAMKGGRPNPLNASTGGTITEEDGYRVHRLTASGTFGASADGTVEVWVIAGGGGGGSTANAVGAVAGGGGAGGVRHENERAVTAGNKTVTVGDGGNPGALGKNNGSKGNNSAFDGLIAEGGGYGAGAASTGTGNTGGDGGSGGGGGGGATNGGAGSGTSGQGSNGEAARGGGQGGHGGGKGGVPIDFSNAGPGITILGTYFAEGGTGTSVNKTSTVQPPARSANSGHGGHGGFGAQGSKGGSGIVIVRYRLIV